MLTNVSEEFAEKVAEKAIGLMWKRARNRIGEWTSFIPNVEPYMRFVSLGVCLLALIASVGLFLIYFLKTGAKFLDDNIFNLYVAIYCALYGLILPFLEIPIPTFQRKVPILNIYHKNFLVRGIVIIVLSIFVCFTVISALPGAGGIIVGCAYIFLLYMRGIEPKWLTEKEEEPKAEYSRLDQEDDDF
ncbi:hypothetical protein FDP41_010623 [Naegleria fowleri]|uniref:Uncharacterized protein n=1 Tax=Naegleria fowleri TaxID=5763 RepID=A0A6A5CDG8_NAEFO|nr:uncharacterized protein FDP41_010623 [Naegleria fowleri]KAF0983558.1 hypothetical protein FDP41_010623 [Naegleria fowleri]CAG4713688.1 unnamed protein product [Naegleria fowleri]